MAEENFLENILAQLKNDSASKSTNRLKKIIMNSPEVVGSTINALPILMEGQLYFKLDAVREFRTYSKYFKDGEQDTWIKLLDKNVYGNLTDEEVELWRKTKDALEELIGSIDDFYKARFRRYTLMPVFITKFTTAEGADNPDMKGTAILIFPSHAPIKALNSAITSMSATSGGNQWMPLVLSPSLKGREGVLSIKFSRSTNTKGYDCSINVVMNGQWTKVVDSAVDYSEGLDFTPIREFLAWQASDDKLFSKEVIEELYENATKELEVLASNQSDSEGSTGTEEAKSPETTPEPENSCSPSTPF